MATLREIRKRISSVRSTQQITKAMKMVAAAKLRRAQDNIVSIRPYALELKTLISRLSAIPEARTLSGLMVKRNVENVLIVPVTGDRGLCGSFNSNILREAVRRAKNYSDMKVEFYTIGRKSYEFFSKRNFLVSDYKVNIFNHLALDDALSISRDLVSVFESGKFDRVEFVYNEFKSAVQQNVIIEQFLPFVPDEELTKSKSDVDYIYEPDNISILNQVIPKDLNIQVWRILLESNAAEQGARMTAMENATENAEEMVGKLTMFYNRARQAAITTEISEIVGGAEALKD
jgi:F-type H+-transporting ATPase subunit gamma